MRILSQSSVCWRGGLRNYHPLSEKGVLQSPTRAPSYPFKNGLSDFGYADRLLKGRGEAGSSSRLFALASLPKSSGASFGPRSRQQSGHCSPPPGTCPPRAKRSVQAIDVGPVLFCLPTVPERFRNRSATKRKGKGPTLFTTHEEMSFGRDPQTKLGGWQRPGLVQ